MGNIGNDFVPQIRKTGISCSECDRWIAKGAEALASIGGGKVRKVVCSEDCRLEFDSKFWQAVARKNHGRRKVGKQ